MPCDEYAGSPYADYALYCTFRVQVKLLSGGASMSGFIYIFTESSMDYDEASVTVTYRKDILQKSH